MCHSLDGLFFHWRTLNPFLRVKNAKRPKNWPILIHLWWFSTTENIKETRKIFTYGPTKITNLDLWGAWSWGGVCRLGKCVLPFLPFSFHLPNFVSTYEFQLQIFLKTGAENRFLRSFAMKLLPSQWKSPTYGFVRFNKLIIKIE